MNTIEQKIKELADFYEIETVENRTFHTVEINGKEIPLTSKNFSVVISVPCINCSKCFWNDGQEVCSKDCMQN